MKHLAFLILACCFFSCQRRENAPPVVDDPKDSVVVVVNPYPMTVAYKGMLTASEMHADMSPEYVHFDTVYAESLNVRYPDSASVIFYLNYWGINGSGQLRYNRDSSHFKINTSGIYLPGRYDFFSYSLKSDSLNIRIHHSGGPSHGLNVTFAGIKARKSIAGSAQAAARATAQRLRRIASHCSMIRSAGW